MTHGRLVLVMSLLANALRSDAFSFPVAYISHTSTPTMPMNDRHGADFLELTGSEAAMLVDALLLAATISFGNPKAKDLIRDKASALLLLHDSLRARWDRVLANAGLETKRAVPTAELMAKRAAIRPALTFELAEWKLAAIAVDATVEEFSGYWKDFCIIAPGGLQMYPDDPGTILPLLAARFARV